MPLRRPPDLERQRTSAELAPVQELGGQSFLEKTLLTWWQQQQQQRPQKQQQVRSQQPWHLQVYMATVAYARLNHQTGHPMMRGSGYSCVEQG